MIIALVLMACLAGVVVCIKRAMPYDPAWDDGVWDDDDEPVWFDDDKRYSGLLEEEE